ncbi:uncharacterized protein L3040_002598 [Drepanopeziza brunnea f. sp. 'multigermtubi']|uniref:uncharacterized protein n=1 Tax=Drepanopeziza brunnea f. sp. 'multigermtubi' TaxID=698441 RepID=UPI0023A24323|nr:hypothetical protein L3040_002598 [Drepanopeziza brunnea f. sp. 'multigermtubi']
MASQIYSRYIPPVRKSVLSSPEAAAPAIDTPKPAHPTPPATRPDASSTYARYVPPSKSKSTAVAHKVPEPTADSGSTPSKRKRDEAVEPSKPVKKSKKDLVSANVLAPIVDIREGNQKETKASNSSAAADAEVVEQGDNDVVQESVGDAASEVERKRENRKKKKVDQDSLENHAAEEITSKERKRKKTPKLTEGDEDGDDPVEKGDQQSRHSKLMEKRKKSLQKAQRLAETTKVTPAAEDGLPLLPVSEEVHDLCPLPQPEPVPELPALPASASLPSWLASPIRVSPTATAHFPDLGISKDVTKALAEKGYSQAFAVQAAVLPLLLTKNRHRPSGDVLVSAATGSGKTLSYVLPMIEDVCRNASQGIRGLIVMPTRELVSQARLVSESCASAFSRGEGYTTRARIGTAVGNETIEAERVHLMTDDVPYDREEYRRIPSLESPLVPQSSDWEDDIFANEDVKPTLPGDISRPRPKVDVLICTPGRLVEHLKSTKGFSLACVKWLIVDEADKLLDQSFQQWLPTVISKLDPRKGAVRKIVLSATMTRDVGQLNQLKLFRPKLVVLEGSSQPDEDISARSGAHVLPALLAESSLKVDDESIKPLYLMELLKRENIVSGLESSTDEVSLPSDSSDDDLSSSDDGSSSASSTASVPKPAVRTRNPNTSSTPRGVLIFTKSNENAVRLGRLIALLSPSASSIIGTLTSTTPTASRHRTIASFASGKISILVASDLVSRGLDLPNLAHVINYDVPNSVESYIHRIGRTARAGKKGRAWTLYTPTEGRWFVNEIGRSENIERASGSKMGRLNIKEDALASRRPSYEEALKTLGKEANSSRTAKAS